MLETCVSLNILCKFADDKKAYMNISGAKVLLVDDEEDILDFMSFILKKEGLKVYTACNGKEAIEKANEFLPHLILMDKMMPVMNGIEACHVLRKNAIFDNTKIVFLSARGDMDSQIEGLEIGADDYLVKPVKTELLLSKIRSIFRSISSPNSSAAQLTSIIEHNGIQVDRKKYLAIKDGTEISLPKKEFELLYLLMKNANEVCKREDILDSVWGKDVFIGDRTIDVHIRKLREKLGDKHFQTIKGVGYKFVAP
jgi:two-component system alkaline phosphatase synthesis response regulator PhoP